jgi:Zn-dependent protease with chaperone function
MEQKATVEKQLIMSEKPCPVCQATIPVHPYYVSWCDKCGWNLQPEARNPPHSAFETIQASIGKKYSEQLFKSLLQAEVPRSRWTMLRILAYSLATSIHVLPLVLAALGIWLLSVGERGLAGLLVTPVPTWSGLMLCAFAYFLLPRPIRVREIALSRNEFPTLYVLADRVAAALRAPRISGIVIHEGFGASFVQAGWRRRPTLLLGLPLCCILDGQEKVTLIAHEIAHSVNGDPTRSFFVGTAIGSLAKWDDILTPDQLAPVEYGLTGYLLVPFNLLRLGLAYGARLTLYGLAHLLWRDAQRAEYLADYLAATVGGTDSALSMLGKLQFGLTFNTTVRHLYLNRSNHNLFDEFRLRVGQVPERELERLRRVERVQPSRTDVVHPPTSYRIEFLRAHPFQAAKVTASSIEQNLVNQELASLETEIQRRLLDAYARNIGGSRPRTHEK